MTQAVRKETMAAAVDLRVAAELVERSGYARGGGAEASL